MLNSSPINSGPINATPDTFVDWAADIDPLTTQTYFTLDIDDGVLDSVRIPISSWQATMQSDRSSYVQAVIPAAAQWVAGVNARIGGDMFISKGVRYEDGTTDESELARVPLQQVRYDEGPFNATLTVSGYGVFVVSGALRTRTLAGLRSVSTSVGGVRVRASIDWFLRPGDTAEFRDQSFVVAYINYYANSTQEFMDVGERAL